MRKTRFEQGKEFVITEIERFIENESEFLPDIHSDALLDRLAKLLKRLKNQKE